MATASGLAKVTADAVDERAEPFSDMPTRQEPLFGDEPKGANCPSSRGKGRPPGAKNRATEDWAEFIRRQHGDVRVGLAQVGFADTDHLAAKLSGMAAFDQVLAKLDLDDKPRLVADLVERAARRLGRGYHDALKLKTTALAQLAPYVASRMPAEVEVKSQGGVVFLMAGTNVPDMSSEDLRNVVDKAQRPVDVFDMLQDVDYQRVSDDDDRASEG
ncbi:hypothetical protein ACSMXM_01280 [Pacificimonas sp. ICDLI1SI03]